jgi:hypothetical protein
LGKVGPDPGANALAILLNRTGVNTVIPKLTIKDVEAHLEQILRLHLVIESWNAVKKGMGAKCGNSKESGHVFVLHRYAIRSDDREKQRDELFRMLCERRRVLLQNTEHEIEADLGATAVSETQP